MISSSDNKKYCVIGAGPCGLAATKQLAARNIPVQCFEREDDVGGNWYFGKPSSSVYESTHLISSKRMTEYTDFPMPKDFPPFPHHTQALQYLRDYAAKFELRQFIRFQSEIVSAKRVDEHWEVTWRNVESGELQTDQFAGLIVANGHHWSPNYPSFAGDFAGETMHAHDYKTSSCLKGKRVLVVGAGNSGCDIAVDAAQHASETFLSMRRGYHFLPKFLYGKPVDACGDWLHRWRMPLWMYRWFSAYTLRIAIGPPQNYGLPKPDHALFESHPIINSQLLYFVGHGRIKIKPNIERMAGNTVHFDDGSQQEIDTIVYATGYNVEFPFMERLELLDESGAPNLFLNTFHPTSDNLFVAGLIQPNSGIWMLADYQSQLIASYLVAMKHAPSQATWFRQLKAKKSDHSSGIDYVKSSRHNLEVEYFGYRKQLQKLLKQFGKVATTNWDGSSL